MAWRPAPARNEINKAREPIMSKPTERIVVFVTAAQKRAIAASAEGLGISVSELMRRAVLSFGATSEQVKAASIVDRLNAPREPDALNEALQRVARTATKPRTAPRAAAKTTTTVDPRDTPNPADVAPPGEQPSAPLSVPDALRAHHDALAATAAAVAAAAGALDAPLTDTSAEDQQAAAEAAARVTAAKAASLAANAAKAPRTRRATHSEEDDSHPDPATPDGHFA